MTNNHKITVKSEWTEDTIFLETDICGIKATEIVKLKEEAVKQALVALGWTPPKPPETVPLTMENAKRIKLGVTNIKQSQGFSNLNKLDKMRCDIIIKMLEDLGV